VLADLSAGRDKLTTLEWKDFLLRSVGLEPETLSDRAKDAFLLRMVPFVERNYNMVELGPVALASRTSSSRYRPTRT
jgi:ATP-dependent Lon protease